VLWQRRPVRVGDDTAMAGKSIFLNMRRGIKIGWKEQEILTRRR
jgi:hypothetical protein